MILLKLFFEFFKVGIFAIGGGMAALPFLEVMGENTGWFTHTDVVNMLAISESTPGPIAINMATYVGYDVAGIPGAIMASLGLMTFSLVVVTIIAGVLKRYQNNRYLLGAFYGIRPASLGLIFAAAIGIVTITLLNIPAFQSSGVFWQVFNYKAILLAAVIFVLTRLKPLKNLHPAAFLAFGAVAGILLKL